MPVKRVNNLLHPEHALEVQAYGEGRPDSHKVSAANGAKMRNGSASGPALRARAVMTRSGPFPLKRLLKQARPAPAKRKRSRRGSAASADDGGGPDLFDTDEFKLDATAGMQGGGDQGQGGDGSRHGHAVPDPPPRPCRQGDAAASALKTYAGIVLGLAGNGREGGDAAARIMAATGRLLTNLHATAAPTSGRGGLARVAALLQGHRGAPSGLASLNQLLPVLLLNLQRPRTPAQRAAARARLGVLTRRGSP